MNARPEADDIHGYYFEELSVGMTASHAKTFTENAEFPTRTMFKGRIEHDMLTTSFISTVLGTKPPGPGCIYLRQDLRFLAPVRPGDTVHSQISITDVNAEKKRAFALTVCRVGDTSVVEGGANLFVPNQRKADAA
mgnify:FL=1